LPDYQQTTDHSTDRPEKHQLKNRKMINESHNRIDTRETNGTDDHIVDCSGVDHTSK